MIVKHLGPEQVWIVGTSKGQVMLLQGVTNIEPHLWEEMKNHPYVKEKLANGNLEILVKDKETKTAAAVEVKKVSLKDLHHKKATKLVSETLDLALLKEWKKEETRDNVLKAITKRMDEILPPLKKDEKQVEVTVG